MGLLLLAVIVAAVSTVAVVGASVWTSNGSSFQGATSVVAQNFRWWHFALAGVAIVLLPWGTASCSANAGRAQAVNNYQQFINGSLISADVKKTDCHEDGKCAHTHDCDSYQVTVVDHEAYTDDDGFYHAKQTHEETRYHDCPYVTEEYTYTVTATYGFKTVEKTISDGDHIFALHPSIWHSDPGSWFLNVSHHYHTSHGVPSEVPEGVPPAWKKYRNDIAHGDADPATAIDKYKNYILASQDSILKAYSPDVDRFLKQGILPEHTQNFRKHDPFIDLLDANKMSFVGFTPSNAALWQKRLMRFNAALGMQLHGDLHIVAIDDHLIGAGESEVYANALKAYWQGPKMGKKALAKNGIMVVLGVSPATSTVVWARAATGMPIGNGAMLQNIEDRLSGKPFNPTTLLGKVTARMVTEAGKSSIVYSPNRGLLGKIMFHDFPFARACMDCTDKNEKGKSSFVRLQADVKVPTWAYLLDVFLALLCGLVGGGVIVATTPTAIKSYNASGY